MYLLSLFGAKALANYLIYLIVVLFQKSLGSRAISALWIIKHNMILETTASKTFIHSFPFSTPYLRDPMLEW